MGKIRYIHEPLLAPSDQMLSAYKMKKQIPWDQFEGDFLRLMAEREVERAVDRKLFAQPTVLLCSEPTAEHCHRRLVLEYLGAKWGGIKIINL